MNIFDKSLKQTHFCYKNAGEMKKAAISMQPEPEPRPPLTLRLQFRKAPRHTPTLCTRLLIFLADYSKTCRAQGLLPMAAQIWPAHFQLNSRARVSSFTHRCAQVFYRNKMRAPGKGSYPNSCAQHYLLHWSSSQHKLNPEQLSPQQSSSQFASHLAAEAATQLVMVSSFRY